MNTYTTYSGRTVLLQCSKNPQISYIIQTGVGMLPLFSRHHKFTQWRYCWWHCWCLGKPCWVSRAVYVRNRKGDIEGRGQDGIGLEGSEGKRKQSNSGPTIAWETRMKGLCWGLWRDCADWVKWVEKPTSFSGLVLRYTKGRKRAVSQDSFISASSLWMQHHQLLQALHQRGLEPWAIVKTNPFSSRLLLLRRFTSATRKGGAPGPCVSGGRSRGKWAEYVGAWGWWR